MQLGEVLNVYRDTKYLAKVEVIQVRDDISAADIKEQSTKIKVGDIIIAASISCITSPKEFVRRETER